MRRWWISARSRRANLNPSVFKLTGRMKQDLFAWPEVEGDANIHGPLSFAIPSSTAGYALMHQRWGKLPLKEVIAPAIALARRGLPADWYTTLKVSSSASVLRNYPESARIYLPDGLPPIAPYQGTPGFFRLGHLLETLERLSEAGLRDFYEGEIAASIAQDVKDMGGVVSLEDLRGCQATTRAATEVSWRGRTLQLTGGLTAAPTLIRVLDRMAEAPYGDAPSAEWYVALARAMKAAYAERLSGSGRRGAEGVGDLHHPSDGVRRRGDDGGGDDHAAVLDGEPGGAAELRRADE